MASIIWVLSCLDRRLRNRSPLVCYACCPHRAVRGAAAHGTARQSPRCTYSSPVVSRARPAWPLLASRSQRRGTSTESARQRTSKLPTRALTSAVPSVAQNDVAVWRRQSARSWVRHSWLPLCHLGRPRCRRSPLGSSRATVAAEKRSDSIRWAAAKPSTGGSVVQHATTSTPASAAKSSDDGWVINGSAGVDVGTRQAIYE